MDELDPFNFSTMGSRSDPCNYYSYPGHSTQFAPTAHTPSGDAMVGRDA